MALFQRFSLIVATLKKQVPKQAGPSRARLGRAENDRKRTMERRTEEKRRKRRAAENGGVRRTYDRKCYPAVMPVSPGSPLPPGVASSLAVRVVFRSDEVS